MQGMRPMAAAAMPPPQMPVMPMYPQPPPPPPSYAAAGMLAGAASDPTLGTSKNPVVMTFVSGSEALHISVAGWMPDGQLGGKATDWAASCTGP
jgi:hypothetical protein